MDCILIALSLHNKQVMQHLKSYDLQDVNKSALNYLWNKFICVFSFKPPPQKKKGGGEEVYIQRIMMQDNSKGN